MIQSELPPGWLLRKVSDVGESIVGQQKNPETTRATDQRPYLRVANVFDDELDLNNIAAMGFDQRARDRYRLRPGDILLCEGQSRELVGRCAMYNGQPDELYFQNTLVRFRPHDYVVPEYALLMFRSYQKSGTFSSIATSTTNIAHLGLRRFTQLPFPLPPKAVQRELADIARAVQDNIDIARDAVRTALRDASVAMTSARDFLILGDKRIGRPGETWSDTGIQWRTAAEAVAADAPIVYGILQPGPDVVDGTGIPYIRGQDLREGHILVDQLRHTSMQVATRYERSSLATGDVLLGIIRHTRVAIVPPELDGAQITQGTARLRPDASIDSGYLSHWLSSHSAQDWLRSRMRGIDMPGLNLRDVRQLPIPVVSLEIQRQLATQLDGIAELSNRLTASLEIIADALDEIEAGVLSSLAYGQLANEVSSRLGITREAQETNVHRSPPRQEQTAKGRSPVKKKREVASGTMNSSVNDENVVQALTKLGGSSSPEELFGVLGASEDAVDSFYQVLRSLVRGGSMAISRPDEQSVLLTVVQNENP